MGAPVRDKTGQRFEKLRVQSLHSIKNGHAQWLCLCDCGNSCIVSGKHLQKQKSCGRCLNEVRHLADGTTIINLVRKDGTTIPCFIDTADYEKVKTHRWYAAKNSRTYYAQTAVQKSDGTETTLTMHQLLFGPGFDHRDHNGLNNRRDNLRSAVTSDNVKNTRKLQTTHRNVSSNYKGVSSRPHNKFGAEIRVNGTRIHLGHFRTEVEAALAYDAASRKHFGEFAAVNFPQPGEQSAIRSIDDTPEGEEP